MKTVMILGAGVPRDAGRNKPKRNQPPLDSDFFDVARAGKYRAYTKIMECLEKLVDEYSITLTQSLETTATYLYLKAIDSKKGSVYYEGFIDLLGLVSVVLADTTNNLLVGRNSFIYNFLSSELKSLEIPSDLTIITFNYDLLIERTLNEIPSNGRSNVLLFPGCYRMNKYASVVLANNRDSFGESRRKFEGVAVLKLHGSMNWLSRHKSPTPQPSTLLNKQRPLHILDSTEISNSWVWKRKRREVYLQPVIIPPISGKKWMMHAAMSEIWDEAANKLREADRVIIAGYSCPPLDFEARVLLSENLRKNPSKKVYVLDPNPQSAAKFLDLCGVNHIKIYSSIKSRIEDVRTKSQNP